MIEKNGYPALLWIIDNSLAELLDKATWLETSAELCNLGWQVTLVSSGFPLEGVDKHIKTDRIPRPKLYFVGYFIFHFLLLFKIIFIYRNVGVILFHQHSAPFLLQIALMRNLFGHKSPKLIFDSRTAPMDIFSLRGRLRAMLFGFAHLLVERLADGQTSITRRLALLQGVSDDQLLGVWPSGVNPERFASAVSLRCWPHGDDPLRLIYIGALYKERNLLAFVEAVRNVRHGGCNVAFELFGDGEQRIELEEFVRKQDDEMIRFRGAVSPAEIPNILASAHIGVLPFPDLPQFQVSSPIKMFEYMASGMPILATRIVSHTDVLKGDFVFWAEDGSVESLAAAIREAVAQKTKLSYLGVKAAEAAQDWTWEASAKKLDVALRKALVDA